jgi:periplasmic copper chaperone A
MRSLLPRLLALVFSVLATAALAQAQALVQVDGAWARATGPGQKTAGAYMRLTAREPLSLVGAESSASAVAELHEMKLDGDVMRMRPVSQLPLPAGRTVELKPGGLHLMLVDLKAPLQPGTRVPVTLLLRDAQGLEQRVALEVPVSTRAPGPAGGAREAGHGGHRH